MLGDKVQSKILLILHFYWGKILVQQFVFRQNSNFANFGCLLLKIYQHEKVINRRPLLSKRRTRYLVADTSRPTGETGLLAVGVALSQVCVGWALLASVGVSVDEKTSRAGDTRGAGLLGVLGHQSAGPTWWRYPVHGVRHTDGVQLHHVADVTAHLQTPTGQVQTFVLDI